MPAQNMDERDGHEWTPADFIASPHGGKHRARLSARACRALRRARPLLHALYAAAARGARFCRPCEQGDRSGEQPRSQRGAAAHVQERRRVRVGGAAAGRSRLHRGQPEPGVSLGDRGLQGQGLGFPAPSRRARGVLERYLRTLAAARLRQDAARAYGRCRV